MKLFEIECVDRKTGKHMYDVSVIHEFGTRSDLTVPELKCKAMELYAESSEHDVLFSDYTRGDPGEFLAMFLDPRGVWIEVTRQTDHRNIGAMYLTNIIRHYDADAHFTLWDGIGSGREPIITKAMEWAIERYDLRRITAEIPAYQSGVIRLTKRLGFIEEGRRRASVFHKGEWVESVIFGILKEEVLNGKLN